MSKIEVDAIEPQSGTSLTLGASGDTVNIASGATITDFTSTGIDDNATSTAITIDSSENVGIGTASPLAPLTVSSGSADGAISLGADVLLTSITNNVRKIGRIVTPSYATAEEPVALILADFNGTDNQIAIGGGSSALNTATKILFLTASNTTTVSGSEAMRIDSSGIVMIGTTDTTPGNGASDKGIAIHNEGISYFARLGGTVMVVCRNTNDGNLVQFNQAGTQEGTISVSGSTVSYNGFTGTHWSRFTDNSTPIILRGTVLESLDEMCDWYNLEFDVTTTTQDEDGNDVTNTSTKKIPHVLTDSQSNGDVITYNHEGTDYQATIVKESDIKHMKSKVSDTVDAKNVYGVFVAYDEDGEGYNDFYVASVGSFVVRIKANETIAKGDLLQSNGDGTAKVQTDDNVKSSSFAKVLSTTVIETYEDGSYLVPCSLMC